MDRTARTAEDGIVFEASEGGCGRCLTSIEDGLFLSMARALPMGEPKKAIKASCSRVS